MAAKQHTVTNYLLSALYSIDDKNEYVVHPVHVNDTTAAAVDVEHGQSGPTGCGEGENVDQGTQTDYDELMDNITTLKEQILRLETDFKDAMDSTLNREMGFREHMSVRLDSLEDLIMSSIQKMDREIYNCLQRRDKQWKRQLIELKPSNTHSIQGTVVVNNDQISIAPHNPSPQSGASPYYPKASPDPAISINAHCPEGLKPIIRDRPDVTTGKLKKTDVGRYNICLQDGMPSTLAELAQAQRLDLNVGELMTSGTPPSTQPSHIQFVVRQGLLYRKVPVQNQRVKYQVVVPRSLVPQFLQHFHSNQGSGHLGRLKTLLRILGVAWWSGVRKDVWEHTKSCRICQQGKADNTKPPVPLLSRDNPMGPFPMRRKNAGQTFTEAPVGRKTKSHPQAFIHRPSNPVQHAALSRAGRQRKTAEKVGQRVGRHQTGAAKCMYSHCKDAHFQKGDLVQALSYPPFKTSTKFSAKFAPWWEGPANRVKNLGLINYRLRWNSPPD